jgi:LysR family nitrogen assimilation transcriptional regulator
LREAVARGDLDMAICHDVAPRPLKTARLYSEPLYLIGPVSDRKLSHSDISVVEVARYPLVMGPPDHALRRCLEEAVKTRGLALTIEQEPADGWLRRSLVLRNGCYTVAAAGMYVAEIKEGFLSARRLVEPDLRQDVNMIYDPAIGTALERTLLSVLRALVADLPEACLTEPSRPSSRKRGRATDLPASV